MKSKTTRMPKKTKIRQGFPPFFYREPWEEQVLRGERSCGVTSAGLPVAEAVEAMRATRSLKTPCVMLAEKKEYSREKKKASERERERERVSGRVNKMKEGGDSDAQLCTCNRRKRITRPTLTSRLTFLVVLTYDNFLQQSTMSE
jgi:hypothetical protein